MLAEDRRFLNRLSERLRGAPFDHAVLEEVKRSGGHDMSDLSIEDLSALMAGQYSGDWYELAFAFGETLWGYTKEVNSNIVDIDVVVWAFCLLGLCDALEQGQSDWDLQARAIHKSFLAVRDHLELDEELWLLKRTFTRRVG